jgi:hypothetical protein
LLFRLPFIIIIRSSRLSEGPGRRALEVVSQKLKDERLFSQNGGVMERRERIPG